MMELMENLFRVFGRDSNDGGSSEGDRLLGSVDVVHDDARVGVLVGLLRRTSRCGRKRQLLDCAHVTLGQHRFETDRSARQIADSDGDLSSRRSWVLQQV